MHALSPLVDSTLTEFTEQLAARTPTPGGGSLAAYLVAAGSALGTMACRFTTGEKFAVVQDDMARWAQALEVLRERSLKLVDLDSRSYDAVTAAYKLPKTQDTEKAARSNAIQAALKGALEVPAETMECAVEALRLVNEALPFVNPNLVSDAATGANCLWSASESALLNVRINAASIQDQDWARSRLDHCLALSEEAHRLLASAKSAAARHLSA